MDDTDDADIFDDSLQGNFVTYFIFPYSISFSILLPCYHPYIRYYGNLVTPTKSEKHQKLMHQKADYNFEFYFQCI